MYHSRGYYTRRFFLRSDWGVVLFVTFLICGSCFTIRSRLLGKPDYLGGLPEIMFFYKVNFICLVLCAIALAIACVTFYIFCVNKDNDLLKLGGFVVSVVLAMISTVLFAISVANIKSDINGTTLARPSSYVLCIRGTNYYVGFEDQQEYMLVPISENTYDSLRKGHETETHSRIYDVINNNSLYSQTVEYDSAISIEYYYYSVMIEKAELLHVK